MEGMMRAGNTNEKCCGWGKLTCVHHVVFAAVSGKRRSRGSHERYALLKTGWSLT
jgi:hypothetical protein